MEKEQKINLFKFFLLCIFLILAILLIKFSSIKGYISPGIIQAKVSDFGIYAPSIFILTYILSSIFLIPGTPLTIAAGILFGKWFGTFYSVIGATIGATLAFIFSRHLGRGFIKDTLSKKYKKLSNFEEKLNEKGFNIVLFLRLVPLFPFNGLNFTLGLTKVKLRDYTLGTLIGIIPGGFLLAYFGDSLANLSILNIAISFILLMLLLSIYPLYNRIKKSGP